MLVNADSTGSDRGATIVLQPAPVLLKNHPSEDLRLRLADVGVTERLARRLVSAALRRSAWPDPGSDLTAQRLAQLRSLAAIPNLTQVRKVVSPRDGFARYVFRGEGAGEFEAVRIPLLYTTSEAPLSTGVGAAEPCGRSHPTDDRRRASAALRTNRTPAPKYVVCVSSQVGCALRCAFCATGRLGFRRNLAAWEIVDQVVKVQADSEHPVRGVVFMGMGEPFLNYDAVLTAIRILSEPCGLAIAAKAITVSTVGIVDGIRRFTSEGLEARLVVSLTAASPARRMELLPVERANPTTEVLQALREYHAATGQRVTLAWTMISGVNVGIEDAQQLADLTRGLPIKLDLIDVNDPTGRFLPPSRAELDAFRDALRARLGMPVVRRYSGGRDIDAACGMLVADCSAGAA